MQPWYIWLGQRRTGAVEAVRVTADDIAVGFAGAEGRDEFLFDAADVAVEDGFGGRTERF